MYKGVYSENQRVSTFHSADFCGMCTLVPPNALRRFARFRLLARALYAENRAHADRTVLAQIVFRALVPECLS